MKTIKSGLFILNMLVGISVLLFSCGGTEEKPTQVEKKAEKEIEVTEEFNLPVSLFIRQLFTLEENISSEAFDSSWSDRRMSWGEEFSETDIPSQNATALLEFESVLLSSAVYPEWIGQRETWIWQTRATGSEADLAARIMELESYIRWEEVGPDWQSMRKDWIAVCESMKNETQPLSQPF